MDQTLTCYSWDGRCLHWATGRSRLLLDWDHTGIQRATCPTGVLSNLDMTLVGIRMPVTAMEASSATRATLSERYRHLTRKHSFWARSSPFHSTCDRSWHQYAHGAVRYRNRPSLGCQDGAGHTLDSPFEDILCSDSTARSSQVSVDLTPC
jgi:hypothetical protein